MGYYDEVAADSPIAFWKLDETSPAGAGSLNDSAGSYDATPVGTATWNQAGPLADGASRAARFDGTTGYATGGTALASALMGAANWTIELWFYADRNNGGTLFAAASGASNRVRIQHFGQLIYTSSSVGGNKSRASGNLTTTWHHLVLTSAGDLYIDGVAQVGTSSAGLNSTVQVTVGAHNNASDFFGGRISCVALYTSVLNSTRVNAHRDAAIDRTVPTGRTFYWDVEQDTPNEYPPGSDDTPSFDQGSSRSTAQAYAGSYSLSLGGGTFRSATFNNPTPESQWATPEEGKVKLRFRYNGSAPGTMMLFQITGKDLSGVNDTNDSVKFILAASGGVVTGGTLTYSYSGGGSSVALAVTQSLAADTWHEMEVRWRTSGSPYLYARLNSTDNSGTSAFGAVNCTAWHHLLIGNDLSTNPTGLWVDEFEVFGGWDGTVGSTFNPGLQTGFGFFA